MFFSALPTPLRWRCGVVPVVRVVVVIVVLVGVIALLATGVASQRVLELVTIAGVLAAHVTSQLGRRREDDGRPRRRGRR